jgi:hypothetical protein
MNALRFLRDYAKWCTVALLVAALGVGVPAGCVWAGWWTVTR